MSEECDNCGIEILKPDVPRLWQELVVCPSCYQKLSQQPPQAHSPAKSGPNVAVLFAVCVCIAIGIAIFMHSGGTTGASSPATPVTVTESSPPIQEWKAFSEKYALALWARAAKVKIAAFHLYIVGNDLVKTNSLTNPYEGIIKMKASYYEGHMLGDYYEGNVEIHFVPDGRKWKFVSDQFQGTHKPPSGPAFPCNELPPSGSNCITDALKDVGLGW